MISLPYPHYAKTPRPSAPYPLPQNDAGTQSFHPPSLPKMNPDRLQNLLLIAGADTAPELLNRLISDLESVANGLHQGFAGPDWPAIKAQSHILISLAGIIGADALHDKAKTLNTLAKAQAQPDQLALYRPILGDLATLISRIATYQRSSPP